MIKQVWGAALLGAAMLVTQAVQAATATYEFTTVESPEGALVPSSAATLTVTENEGALDFVLTSTLDDYGTGSFIGKFLYEVDGIDFDSAEAEHTAGLDFVFSEVSGTPTGLSFDFSNAYKNSADGKLYDDLVSAWTLSGDTDLTLADLGNLMVHVQSTDAVQGTSSLWISGSVAPIPEPETYAMLLTGLVVAGLFGRKRAARRII